MNAGNPRGPTGIYDTTVIDSGTISRSLSPVPGPMAIEQKFIDEMTPIAKHMSHEINTNAKSKYVRFIRGLILFSDNKSLARALWVLKVKPNADWDHKPIIKRLFAPHFIDGENWHLYGDTFYRYDVWSNAHFGYVGLAAGFSESDLLSGASIAQLGSDLISAVKDLQSGESSKEVKLPKKTPDVPYLEAWDPAPDRAAIKLGIILYRSHPSDLSAKVLLNHILKDPDIRTKKMPKWRPAWFRNIELTR